MDKRVYDLDVPWKTLTPQLIARLLDAGYHCIGVSQTVSIDAFNFLSADPYEATPAKKKKTKSERQEMRDELLSQLTPPTLSSLNRMLSESDQHRTGGCTPLEAFCAPRFFRRITVTCVNPSLAGLFFREFGERLNGYDIVSFCPKSSEALAYACEQVSNVEMVTLELTNMENGCRLSSKQWTTILSRGLHVEFQLRPILLSGSTGTTARGGLAHFMYLLSSMRSSTAKALVVSSGATSSWEVRRPCSVASVLRCVGLHSTAVAYSTITKAPYAVLVRGLQRSHTAHGAVALLRILPSFAVSQITEGNEDAKQKDAAKMQSVT